MPLCLCLSFEGTMCCPWFGNIFKGQAGSPMSQLLDMGQPAFPLYSGHWPPVTPVVVYYDRLSDTYTTIQHPCSQCGCRQEPVSSNVMSSREPCGHCNIYGYSKHRVKRIGPFCTYSSRGCACPARVRQSPSSLPTTVHLGSKPQTAVQYHRSPSSDQT